MKKYTYSKYGVGNNVAFNYYATLSTVYYIEVAAVIYGVFYNYSIVYYTYSSPQSYSHHNSTLYRFNHNNMNNMNMYNMYNNNNNNNDGS